MIIPRDTDCELVVDPTRFVATHRYSPISEDAMLLMVSDGVFKFPPECLLLSVKLKFTLCNNQCISVNAGEPCETLAVQ